MKRTFIPGEEWLYIKLYTGFKTADGILTGILPDVLKKFFEEKTISKWFFIRYADPHIHLRFRFYVENPKDYGFVLTTFKDAIKEYVDQDLIWKVQVETYQREIERYGKTTIELAENFFCVDSNSTIRLLSLLEGDSADFKRCLIAFKIIDCLLDDFEFDLVRKQTFMSQLSNGFRAEFGFVHKEHKVSLDLKYRSLQKPINDLMLNPNEKFDWYEPVNAILSEKSAEMKDIAGQLLKMEAEQSLEIPLPNLLGSYIHMMVNRFFQSNQRLTEMVIYDLLGKYYTSAIARLKYSSKTKQKEETEKVIVV